MPKSTSPHDRLDPMREEREEVVGALLHCDRSHHDELGRTRSTEVIGDSPSHSSPREQGAAPIDLHNVDE